MNVPTIFTEFIYPPIPLRQFDWRATLFDYSPGDPIGHGATESEAIADLLLHIEERNA